MKANDTPHSTSRPCPCVHRNFRNLPNILLRWLSQVTLRETNTYTALQEEALPFKNVKIPRFHTCYLTIIKEIIYQRMRYIE